MPKQKERELGSGFRVDRNRISGILSIVREIVCVCVCVYVCVRERRESVYVIEREAHLQHRKRLEKDLALAGILTDASYVCTPPPP